MPCRTGCIDFSKEWGRSDLLVLPCFCFSFCFKITPYGTLSVKRLVEEIIQRSFRYRGTDHLFAYVDNVVLAPSPAATAVPHTSEPRMNGSGRIYYG